MLCLNSRNVNNYDLHDYLLSFLLTQHRHDGDWDKADKQDLKKKAGRTEEDPWSPEPAKTPSHHQQRKMSAKVEQIRVVSLKISIKCCANVNNYGLCNILSLTQHRHDADWDKVDQQDFENKSW